MVTPIASAPLIAPVGMQRARLVIYQRSQKSYVMIMSASLACLVLHKLYMLASKDGASRPVQLDVSMFCDSSIRCLQPKGLTLKFYGVNKSSGNGL